MAKKPEQLDEEESAEAQEQADATAAYEAEEAEAEDAEPIIYYSDQPGAGPDDDDAGDADVAPPGATANTPPQPRAQAGA